MRIWPFSRPPQAPPPRRKSIVRTKSEQTAEAVRESAVLDVRAGGRRLRAVVIGKGPKHAPTLVFVHEGLGCIALWREFPTQLARATGCTALVYERQGHGGAEPLDGPRPLDHFEHEAEVVLPDMLDYFGIERATFIGHSDGGTIALLFAAAFPARTQGVVAIAAHAFVEAAALKGVRKAVASFEASRGFRDRLERYHGENAEAMFRAWAGFWLSEGFRPWTIEARLKAVVAPALLIQGTADDYATPEHLARIAAACGGPCQSLLIEGAGHTPQRDQPERVTEAITAFLKILYER